MKHKYNFKNIGISLRVKTRISLLDAFHQYMYIYKIIKCFKKH